MRQTSPRVSRALENAHRYSHVATTTEDWYRRDTVQDSPSPSPRSKPAPSLSSSVVPPQMTTPPRVANDDFYRRDTADDSSASIRRSSPSKNLSKERVPAPPPPAFNASDQPPAAVLEEARRWSAELERRKTQRRTLSPTALPLPPEEEEKKGGKATPPPPPPVPPPAPASATPEPMARPRTPPPSIGVCVSSISEITASRTGRGAGAAATAAEEDDDDSELVEKLKSALLSKLIPVCRALDITSTRELREYGYEELAADMRVHASYTLLPNTWKKIQGLVARESSTAGLDVIPTTAMQHDHELAMTPTGAPIKSLSPSVVTGSPVEAPTVGAIAESIRVLLANDSKAALLANDAKAMMMMTLPPSAPPPSSSRASPASAVHAAMPINMGRGGVDVDGGGAGGGGGGDGGGSDWYARKKPTTPIRDDWYRRDTLSDSTPEARARRTPRRYSSYSPGALVPAMMMSSAAPATPPPPPTTPAARSRDHVPLFSDDQPPAEVLEEAKRWSAELERRKLAATPVPRPLGASPASVAAGASNPATRHIVWSAFAQNPTTTTTPYSTPSPAEASPRMSTAPRRSSPLAATDKSEHNKALPLVVRRPSAVSTFLKGLLLGGLLLGSSTIAFVGGVALANNHRVQQLAVRALRRVRWAS